MGRGVLVCATLWLGLVGLGLFSCAEAAPKTNVAPGASVAPGIIVDDARLSEAADEPQNWLAHGGAHPDWYFSSLDKINVTNVERLRPAWFVELDTTRGQEATPLIADGEIYTTTAWSRVLALDARTGKVKWTFDPQVPGHAGYKSCCDVVNRGPALYLGNLYISTIDGRLIALNVATGKLVWSVLTVDPSKMYAITGAPRVMQGKVIIGNGGGELGSRGYVSAYDATDGKLLWRFYTVPGAPGKVADGAASDTALEKIALPTWRGHSYESGGGGQVWNAITPDPQFGQIYIGTANPFPWVPKYRSSQPNDYLFTDSIVALDARTGQYRWHYQEVPDDAWDYDAAEDMMLLDMPIAGEQRPVLMQAAKDGFFYVLDRKTGKLLSAAAYVDGITWARGIDKSTGRPLIDPQAAYPDKPFIGSPGPAGAHSWRPASYDPLTKLVYIPAQEATFKFVAADSYKFQDGVDDLGVAMGAAGPQTGAGAPAAAGAATASAGATGPSTAAAPSPAPAPPVKSAPQSPAALPPTSDFLLAWDPIAQRRAWKVPTVGGGGILSTAGNLVFQGQHRKEIAGEIVAYRADTGERLWSFSTPNAMLTGPVTYSVAGEQYIAVMTGAGGSADLISRGSDATFTPAVGKLIVFQLDGKAALPPDPQPAPPPQNVNVTASTEAVGHGAALFARYCSRCHARDAKSHNVVPDLRRSGALADEHAWKAIVIDGALESFGMISWARFLSPSDAENIRAYVASEAHKVSAAPPAGAER
jgi:PQQ-dependent dehydrogenase (methanol/ethanol family)